jgi:hypothetical protein
MGTTGMATTRWLAPAGQVGGGPGARGAGERRGAPERRLLIARRGAGHTSGRRQRHEPRGHGPEEMRVDRYEGSRMTCRRTRARARFPLGAHVLADEDDDPRR